MMLMAKMITLIIGILLIAMIHDEMKRRKSSTHSSGFFTPNNMIGPAPTGSWTETQLGITSEVVTYFSLAVIIGLVWIAANIPELFSAALFYLVLLVLFALVWAVETKFPEWRWVAFLGFGPVERWLQEVLIGITFGISFLVLVQVSGLTVSPTQVYPIAAPMLMITFIGVLVPFAEEASIGAILTPTIVEDFGILPGILAISFLFGIFHWTVFAGAWGALLLAMLFRAGASVLILKRRAFLCAFVAHVIVNMGALLIRLPS